MVTIGDPVLVTGGEVVSGPTCFVVVIGLVTVVYILVVVVSIDVIMCGLVVVRVVVARADVVVRGEFDPSFFVVVVVRGLCEVVREGAVTSVPEAVVRNVVTVGP